MQRWMPFWVMPPKASFEEGRPMSWLTRVVPKNVRDALLAAWRAAVAALLASLFGHVNGLQQENVDLRVRVAAAEKDNL